LRQIVQHLGSGRTELLDVPAPGSRRGRLLVRATRSLVSLGTERMLVEFGRGSWLSKARQQPEKFRAVLAKVRSEGLFATVSAIRSKLAQPIPLGYCHVGQVLAKLKELGLDDNTIDEMMAAADTNQDGEIDLAEIFIVSAVHLGREEGAVKTANHKCGRCWRHLPEVVDDGALCGRCADVVGG
jgi:hypothetical protein